MIWRPEVMETLMDAAGGGLMPYNKPHERSHKWQPPDYTKKLRPLLPCTHP